MDRKTQKLLDQLDSDNAKTRYEAVMALGKTGDTDLINALDRVANLDEHPKVRELASKAVQTLEILQKRRLQRERAAQEIAEEGEDNGYQWPDLMKDKMMDQRQVAGGDVDEFDYEKSRQREIERKEAEVAEKESAKMAEKETERSIVRKRRRRFRMLLWVSLAVAVVGLFVVAWYVTSVERPPDSREATLIDLREWVLDQQAAVVGYETEFQNDPLNCAALQEIGMPDRPKWTELLTVSELAQQESESGILVSVEDDLNRIDESLLGGLEPVLNDLSRSHNRLEDIQSNVDAACSAGTETVPQASWANFSQLGGFTAQAMNSTVNAASAIEQELAALEE